MPASSGSEPLLKLLSDGGFHSGTALGEQLGVSRAAVWKQLQKLESQGVVLESVKGKGYRLAEGVSLLRADIIRQHLHPDAAKTLRDIHCKLTTASTNADAMRAIQQGNQSGLLLTAETQTAGRGRRGREWVSPFARNLYFSLVWSFEGGAAALEGLSLLVGLSLVKALESQGVSGLQLKWPNDVWLNEQKLAGVLLEMSGDASGFCQVVIGVGLNVTMPQQEGEAIGQQWTTLTQQGFEFDRNQLLGSLLNQLIEDLRMFSSQGFAVFQSDWLRYDVCKDRLVLLQEYQSERQGVAKGVDASGALLLETSAGVERVFGGEVSLKIQ